MRRLVAVAMPVLLTLVLVACSTARLVDAPNTDTPAAGPTTSPAAVTIPGTASTAACSAAARWARDRRSSICCSSGPPTGSPYW
jgi:hypothetical protein